MDGASIISRSVDLRDRVVAAIVGGLSRRQAAVRFGVSAASAVRWQERANQHGTRAPQQQGGDRRSMRIEAHAGLVLDAYKAMPDITLTELQAFLADHGTEVALGTIWRFFARRGITRKKRMAHRVCKSEFGQRAGLHQRIRSQGFSPGKIDLARHGPHKDGGVEHKIFTQASRRGVNLYAICPSPSETS